MDVYAYLCTPTMLQGAANFIAIPVEKGFVLTGLTFMLSPSKAQTLQILPSRVVTRSSATLLFAGLRGAILIRL